MWCVCVAGRVGVSVSVCVCVPRVPESKRKTTRPRSPSLTGIHRDAVLVCLQVAVVLIGEDAKVGEWEEPQRVVEGPVHWAYAQRQRAEMRLLDDRLDKL